MRLAGMRPGLGTLLLGVLAMSSLCGFAQGPSAISRPSSLPSAPRANIATASFSGSRAIAAAPIHAAVDGGFVNGGHAASAIASAAFGNSLEINGSSDIPVQYGPGQSAEIMLYSSGSLQEKLYDAFDNPGQTDTDDMGFAMKVAGAKLRFMMGSGDVQLTSQALMSMAKAAAYSEAAFSAVSAGGHFGFRLQGRMLVDPSPFKYYPIVSTVNFYYVGKPAFSAFYRF